MTSGNQNKKSLEVELNLAPFLDILSVCICFLLISAVWVLQEGIPMAPTGKGGNLQASTDSLRVDYLSPSTLRLSLKSGGNRKSQTLKGKDFLDLRNQLSAWLDRNVIGAGEKNAVVGLVSGLKYGDFIATADVLRAHGFERVAVKPEGNR